MKMNNTEAKELRIGNLIFSKETQSVQKITGITEESPFFDAVTFDYPTYEDIEPIPLTEEWLLKFGFYKNIDTGFFEKGGYQVDFDVLKCFFYLPEFGDWYKELEHVHQLQNLYFALTGEELEIKE